MVPSRRIVAAGLCLVLCSGCGRSDRAKVSGQVRLGSQPLAEGFVSFRPAPHTAGPEFSGSIVEGRYAVAPEVLPGDYLVEVRAWQKTGRIVKSPFGTDTEEIVNAVPPRYWGPQTELSVELKPGDNTADFQLQP